jgi:hypothetical protein
MRKRQRRLKRARVDSGLSVLSSVAPQESRARGSKGAAAADPAAAAILLADVESSEGRMGRVLSGAARHTHAGPQRQHRIPCPAFAAQHARAALTRQWAQPAAKFRTPPPALPWSHGPSVSAARCWDAPAVIALPPWHGHPPSGNPCAGNDTAASHSRPLATVCFTCRFKGVIPIDGVTDFLFFQL